jgi:dienelactone hydrolase
MTTGPSKPAIDRNASLAGQARVLAHVTRRIATAALLLRILGCICLIVGLAQRAQAEEPAQLASDLHETIVEVPMTERGLFGDKQRELTATVYRPEGDGPFPLIVLSHGNPPNAFDRSKIGRFRKIAQIREFVARGFAVIVPIRRGYGATGGSFAEDTGSCEAPDYEHAGLEAAKDLLATIRFAGTVSYVDSQRIVLVGQSAGGFASLAAASLSPPGVIAVVNFSGGRGGNPTKRPGAPCAPERMTATISHFAATTHVPVLWHYVENDQYFAPEVVRQWFSAFQSAGGTGQLVIEPPFGRDGHGMFMVDRAIPIWEPWFDRFLSTVPLLSEAASPGMASGIPAAEARTAPR